MNFATFFEDFDDGTTPNGYPPDANSNNGSGAGTTTNNNNPSGMSYNPEASSVVRTGGLYHQHNQTHPGSNNNNNNHNHMSSGLYPTTIQQHHTVMTPAGVIMGDQQTFNHAFHPQHPAGEQTFAGTNNYAYGNGSSNSSSRSLSPYGGATTNAALQMAGGGGPLFDPLTGALSQPLPHNQHDASSSLEGLFLMGAFQNHFANPAANSCTTTNPGSFNGVTNHHTSTSSRNRTNQHKHSHHRRTTVAAKQRTAAPDPPSSSETTVDAAWMAEITLSVPSLSLQPLTGAEIIQRIQSSIQDVSRRYIPCVAFLVQCQQELRKGIQAAQIKQATGGRRGSSSGYRGMSPRQFYSSYIEGLPNRFYLANDRRMENTALQEALQGLQKLKADAKNVMNQGCEAMKNSFLGGMKEGESWGLRRWLSKNGNALRVCTDLECILKACKEMDKSKDATKKLATLVRPLAKQTLDKLKRDIPASYQERSSAHPYLPFFHRLEAALRNMSQFDPEDDGVICLDDSDEDDDEPIVILPPSKQKALPRKRKVAEVEEITIDLPSPSQKAADEPPQKKRVFENEVNTNDTSNDKPEDDTGATTTATTTTVATTTTTTARKDDDSSSGESDLDSVIEIVRESVRKDKQGFKNDNDLGFDSDLQLTPGAWDGNRVAGEVNAAFFDSSDEESPSTNRQRKAWAEGSHRFPVQPLPDEVTAAQSRSRSFAHKVRGLVDTFQTNGDGLLPSPARRARFGKKNQFWDIRYHEALRIFSELLFHPEAMHFMDSVDELGLMRCGHPSYGSIILNPLCFADIATSLIDEDPVNSSNGSPPRFMSGILPRPNLDKWNMWRGMDLLQALDLVLLNSLAYGKVCEEGKSKNRSRTNELRKQLWDRIQEVVNDNEYDAERRKRATPTRRADTSGFVVLKTKA